MKERKRGRQDSVAGLADRSICRPLVFLLLDHHHYLLLHLLSSAGLPGTVNPYVALVSGPLLDTDAVTVWDQPRGADRERTLSVWEKVLRELVHRQAAIIELPAEEHLTRLLAGRLEDLLGEDSLIEDPEAYVHAHRPLPAHLVGGAEAEITTEVMHPLRALFASPSLLVVVWD